MYGRGGVDVFAPDYAAAPLFRGADCFDDVVHPGEFVFYPSGWCVHDARTHARTHTYTHTYT